MRRKKPMAKADVLREMMRLSGYPVNDAVKLAYLSEESREEISALDLHGITEFKRNSNGTVELKFTDRMAVLEALLTHMDEEAESGVTAFLRALEEPAGEQAQATSRR